MEHADPIRPAVPRGLPPEPPPQPVFAIEGNRLTLLDTGPRRLNALLGLIEGARRSLRLLYYIYSDDGVGERVRDALTAVVARGAEVTLIVDGLGSDPAYDNDFFAPLREAGGNICFFVPRLGRRYLLRNHQKIALADAETADARIVVADLTSRTIISARRAAMAGAIWGCWWKGPRRRGSAVISMRCGAGPSGRAHRCACCARRLPTGASPRASCAG